ncbi:MAG: hypothetical protein ACLUFU_03260 [Bacilli bacterium]
MKGKNIKLIYILLLFLIIFGIAWIIKEHNLTIFDKIDKTDKVFVRNNFDSEKNLLIVDLNKIEEIVRIIKNRTEISGDDVIYYSRPMYTMTIYNNNKIITKIDIYVFFDEEYNCDFGWIIFEDTNQYYYVDICSLLKIVENK